MGESIVAKVVISAVINTVGIGALIISGGTVGGFGYYNGKSDWMINFGIRKPNSMKFVGINMGGDKEGFYMYGQTVVPFNSPPNPVQQTNSNYENGSSSISDADLDNLGNNSKVNFNSVEYTGFYYDNAEEMRNQLHHMSDMQGGVELLLAQDYKGGAYLLPSKVYDGNKWWNNGPDNAYWSNYHLEILNLNLADIKIFGHDHDRNYRFTDPDDYKLYDTWKKSIYIIMPYGRIHFKYYPTGTEYDYLPNY